MRAQVLYGIGNIRFTEIETPAPGAEQALVRVTRCGICGSDIPRIYKTGAHNMPLIPGHEMAGIVEQCESRPDLIGKKVGVFPLIPCKKCSQCLAGHYEMCENYNYLGSRCDGGFAEYVAAPVWNLIPVGDEVADDDAAMLEPVCVAVHAMRLMGILDDVPENKSKSIVVCGLGTIGLLVALLLRDKNYENVLLVGNKDIQKQKILEMGYPEEQFCDVRYCEPATRIMDRTGGRGADFYFECIGRTECYEQAVKCTAPLGNIMLVGNPASDMTLTREVYWKILRNQITLRGTWNSRFSGIDGEDDDWRYALTRASAWTKARAEGQKLLLPSDLVTHRFGLEDMQKGLDIMNRKSEEYIKIMVE
jgi:L-iditol 2-dehydrogenase